MIMSQLKNLFFRPRPAPERHEFEKSPQSPLLEVDKWAASEYFVKLAGIIGFRPYPMDELLLMTAAFAYHRPEVVIDIGTHQGKSARIWWELSREYNVPCEINTIDLYDPAHAEYPGGGLGRYIYGTPVRQHIGDGAEVAKTIIEANPGKRFLLFLDGDHAYQTVRRELELVKLIENSGVLVHDTFYQPGSGYNHGPYEAITDFCRETSCAQVVHLSTGLPGMSYLMR